MIKHDQDREELTSDGPRHGDFSSQIHKDSRRGQNLEDVAT